MRRSHIEHIVFSTAMAALIIAAVPFVGRAATIQVDVRDNLFSPKNLTITDGDTVVWTNKGSILHTVTADSGAFDSGNLLSNQTFSHTFSTGSYPYYCVPHGSPGGVGMSGSVTVVASASASAGAVAPPQPQASISSGELRVRIEALLQQIGDLQAQLGVNPQIPQTPNIGAPVQSGTVQCPFISRSLKLGSSGDDVARLQRFLALDPSIYPEAIVSGYYGRLTESAVKRFQCKNKIVCEGSAGATGYGVTGPRTAALLALQCPEANANAGGFIRVSPISGPAPLPVSVDVTVNTTKSCAAVSYELDFGDNAPRALIDVPANACSEVRQLINHTYNGGGTYIVTLRSGTQQVNATVTVTGSSNPNPSGDPFTASPVSGNAPLSVLFSGIMNPGGTCNAGAYSIDFGDGQSVPLTTEGCSARSFSVTHIYASGSNYIARLRLGSTDVKSITIAVSGESSGAGGGFFSVSPAASGDAYSVEAEFELSSSCTRYDLEWGDASIHSSQTQGTCSGGVVTKKLSHTFTDAGNFTITLKRGANLSSVDTVGVSVVY